LLPGEGAQDRLMPYISYSNGNPETFDDNSSIIKLELNYFMNGYISKLTLEYTNTVALRVEGLKHNDAIILQMPILLQPLNQFD